MGEEQPDGPGGSGPDAGGFPVVGLGASAGGLVALEAFFAAMPPDSGMAFVVVTHQHPDQPTMLPELLGRVTEMPVVMVQEQLEVEPDHVYASRPGYYLECQGGTLRSVKPPSPPRMAIDHFLHSLAADRGPRAVAVILSGTGSDGSQGIQAVRRGGGRVLAQDLPSAQQTGMPSAAVATHAVDAALPPSQMPDQLRAWFEAEGNGDAATEASSIPDETLRAIVERVQRHTGHDFSHYKPSTMCRRIERRIHAQQVAGPVEYLALLERDADEVARLFRELLVGVTSFFRDPEAWEVLANALAPRLAEQPERPVLRAWVAACSTGEEAYTLAMVLSELVEASGRPLDVQIFATDLDPIAIDVARAGWYPAAIEQHVAADRLERFFVREGGGYRVRSSLRDMLVFATQNVIGDPPFSKLDLLCCRNLLIYLDGWLQERLLPLFHYALLPGGLLFLGPSETIGDRHPVFRAVSHRWRLFRAEPLRAGYPTFDLQRRTATAPSAAGADARPAARRVDQLARDALLVQLVPPTVVIRERGDVVLVQGRTGRFLEPAEGPPGAANLFNMVRNGLSIALAVALRRAIADETEVLQDCICTDDHGDAVSVTLRVAPLTQPEALRGLYRVSFVADDDAVGPGEARALAGPGEDASELQRALVVSQENHRGAVEELTTVNEELTGANEELQSTNEELQSANEELETSKEEMQALNEELNTVNAELQDSVVQLSRANNDMKNLLNGTDIATVFLDGDLRIKRFTDRARHIIRLIPSDVGRPIGDLVSTLQYDHLVQDAQRVLETLVVEEVEVSDADGRHMLVRILPYRTTENLVEGLVLTFIDLTRVRTAEADTRAALDALRSADVSIVGKDEQLRVAWAITGALGLPREELVGRSDEDLFPADQAAAMERLQREALESGEARTATLSLTLAGTTMPWWVLVQPHEPPSQGLTLIATPNRSERP